VRQSERVAPWVNFAVGHVLVAEVSTPSGGNTQWQVTARPIGMARERIAARTLIRRCRGSMDRRSYPLIANSHPFPSSDPECTVLAGDERTGSWSTMGYALSTFLSPPTKFQAHFVNGGSAAPASVARRHLDALSVVACVDSFGFGGPRSSFRPCCTRRPGGQVLPYHKGSCNVY
jgi:hypothetical protein